MALTTIHSYLVRPSKGIDKQPKIGGAEVTGPGQLFDVLSDIYEKSSTECNIDIAFTHNSDGKQQNDCRDAIVKYVGKPSLPGGRSIAKSLQEVTTNRSGLGLLFLLVGKESEKYKLVVSRFPAENGILADLEGDEDLKVEFIEKVFMKNAHSYKAAMYTATSLKTGFWSGKAVDKQINSQLLIISDYWIKEFLLSDLKTTSAAGTKRLANAIRQAITKSSDLKVKEELILAARFAPKLNGKSVSIASVARQAKLSTAATDLLKDQLHSPHLFTEQFKFSEKEYEKYVVFETTELENGAIMMAPAGKFKELFKPKPVKGSDGEVEFSAKGRVSNLRIRKSKL